MLVCVTFALAYYAPPHVGGSPVTRFQACANALEGGRPSSFDGAATREEALVRAHDYSCIARGEVFVARSWLSEDMLRALRADARALLERGEFDDMDEPIGRRLKRELYRTDWAYGDEEWPTPARADARRLFEALRVELAASWEPVACEVIQ